MDLSLSETEDELAASARAFVEAAVADQVRAMAPDDPGVRAEWQRVLAASGWLGMFVPAEHGGLGATALQTAVVFEQFGRGPLPFLPLASATAVRILTADGIPGSWRSGLLPAIAEGTFTCVPAGLDQLWASGGGADLGLALIPGRQGLRLSGVVPSAAFAGSADELLVVLRDQADFRVVRVPATAPGVSTRLLGGLLAWHYEVRLDDAEVPAQAVTRVTRQALLESLGPAMLWTASYAVGGCSRLLEMSREYCGERIQFGQPIGRYQRVQDHVIRILNFTDQARWGLYEALWRTDQGLPAAAGTHLAKAAAAEGYWESANAAHEIHAGIGSDPLFGLVPYTAAARTLLHFLGSPRWHKRQMITAVLQDRRQAQPGRRAPRL